MLTMGQLVNVLLAIDKASTVPLSTRSPLPKIP